MAVRLNNRIHAAEGDFRRILVVLRLPKGQNGGKQKMKKEDREMLEKIMATEKVGYAYVYPMDGGARKEHYISMTSENIANYIGTYMVEAESMVFTDIADNLELNTFGCFINTCTSRKLCMELQELLFPIQCGDEEPGEVLAVDRSVADKYFQQEDEAVTMAEMSMP